MLFKYVIFQVSGGYLSPVFSPENSGVLHSDLYIQDKYGIKGIPVRAGFCLINSYPFTIKCYGKSISLNLKSDPEKDQELIKRMLNIG